MDLSDVDRPTRFVRLRCRGIDGRQGLPLRERPHGPRAYSTRPLEGSPLAWTTSTRRERLPANWPRIRRRILHRDGHACTATFSDGRRCGMPATDVDHIIPGDDHSDANLRALCGWCHAQKSASEGGTAAASRAVRTTRPKAPHPALED
ncbi:HNH endonuclease [Kitasatospora sp. NPDC086009]|uniref:HNH endonuclease n=1 Tax=unclassified Kitasatospora TaxID=2633591 RepID=UPI0037C95DC6